MMTALGIGLLGAGVLLIYAGVTNQNVLEELAGAFGAGAAHPPTPSSSGKSGLTPGPNGGQSGGGAGGGEGGSW